MTTPLTPSQRVRRANASLIARGGHRLSGHLQPDATQALNDLVAAGYATSVVAAITAALLDAHKKIKRNANT